LDLEADMTPPLQSGWKGGYMHSCGEMSKYLWKFSSDYFCFLSDIGKRLQLREVIRNASFEREREKVWM
jgi:hypothetical protein